MATAGRASTSGDSVKCKNCRTSSLLQCRYEDKVVGLWCQNKECLSEWVVAPTSSSSERPTVKYNNETFFFKPPGRLGLSITMDYEAVQDVTGLKPGGHIIFKRYSLYDHHAIVSTMNSLTLDVIHWTSGCPSLKSLFTRKSEALRSMKNENISFPSGGVRRVVYDWQDQTELFLARAFSLLQSEKNYVLTVDNCEYFATYCKTGDSYSGQWQFRPHFQQVEGQETEAVCTEGVQVHLTLDGEQVDYICEGEKLLSGNVSDPLITGVNHGPERMKEEQETKAVCTEGVQVHLTLDGEQVDYICEGEKLLRGNVSDPLIIGVNHGPESMKVTLCSYSRLKENLVSRLGRDDCEKLTMSSAISAGEELNAVLNSERPASTLPLASEEKGVISSFVERCISRLKIPMIPMSPMIPSFYRVNMYQKLRVKQRLTVKQRMDARPSRWTCFLAVLTVGLVAIPLPSDAEHCPKRQAAELGKPGLINCSLPEDFYDVYWFDSISESSPFVIRFQPNEGRVKSGPGFESGDYDVLENGSLKITNVTSWHERKYRLIISKQSSQTPENLLISLNVTATPIDNLPAIPCSNCHQDYYYSVMEGEILSCAFNATKPPVQLEWFEQRGDGYERVEMQQLNKTENSNGTFNSLATIHLPKDSTGLIHLLACRATWPLSDWRREQEILLDFSSSFSDVTSKVQYMEVNKYSKILCGQPASAYVIWKRLLSDNNPETIGFSSHSMTETISSTQDVVISAEGSLVFASPGVHQEGIYTCIYGDGQNEEIQTTSVQVLIPPSPPYIHITGCDDESYRCVIREDSTKKLTCAVYGARPNVTLEWIAEDEDDVSFFNHKLVFKKRGETYDTILSVEHKVSQDVLCGEEILIKCHLYGPLANIMKAESTALVIPASCRENEVKEEHGLNGVVIALAVLNVPMLIVIAFGIIYHRHLMYNGFLQTETEEAGKQIPNGTPSCNARDTDEECGLMDSKQVSV